MHGDASLSRAVHTVHVRHVHARAYTCMHAKDITKHTHPHVAGRKASLLWSQQGGAAADIASGDLPSDVEVAADWSGGDGADEGRAMLQLVHDVVPEAKLCFHHVWGGITQFAQAIQKVWETTHGRCVHERASRLFTESLSAQVALLWTEVREFSASQVAGCPPGSYTGCVSVNRPANVIVDDVIYFGEPFFQDGLIAQAVDIVTKAGVVYVSAAGVAQSTTQLILTCMHARRQCSLPYPFNTPFPFSAAR